MHVTRHLNRSGHFFIRCVRHYGKKKVDTLAHSKNANIKGKPEKVNFSLSINTDSKCFLKPVAFPSCDSLRSTHHNQPFWNKLSISVVKVGHVEGKFEEVVLTKEKPFPLRRKPIAICDADKRLETPTNIRKESVLSKLNNSIYKKANKTIHFLSNDLPSQISSLISKDEVLPLISLPSELGTCKPSKRAFISHHRKSSTDKASSSGRKYFWWFDKDSNLIVTHYKPKVTRQKIPILTNEIIVPEKDLKQVPNDNQLFHVSPCVSCDGVSSPSSHVCCTFESVCDEIEAKPKDDDIVRSPLTRRKFPDYTPVSDIGSMGRAELIINKDLYITSKVIKSNDADALPERPIKKEPEPLEEIQKFFVVNKKSDKDEPDCSTTDCGDVKYGTDKKTSFNIATRKTNAILEEGEYRQSIANRKEKKMDLPILPRKGVPPKGKSLQGAFNVDAQALLFELDPIFNSLNTTIYNSPDEDHFPPFACFLDHSSSFLIKSLATPFDKLTVTSTRSKHESTSSSKKPDQSLDYTTKTIILASKNDTRTDIKIIEVEKFTDLRVPVPFTTETFFQIAGDNQKIKPFMDIIDSTKPKFNIILGKEKKQSNPKTIEFPTPTPQSPVSKASTYLTSAKCDGIIIKIDQKVKESNANQPKIVQTQIQPESSIRNVLKKLEKEELALARPKTETVRNDTKSPTPTKKSEEPKPLETDKNIHDYVQKFSKAFFGSQKNSVPIQGTVIDHTKPPKVNTSDIKDNPQLKLLKDCSVVKKNFPEVIEVASETEKSFSAWSLTARDLEVINELIETNSVYSKLKSRPEFKRLKKGLRSRVSTSSELKEAILSKLKKNSRPRKRLKSRSNLLKTGLNAFENSGKQVEKVPSEPEKNLPSVSDITVKKKPDFNLSFQSSVPKRAQTFSTMEDNKVLPSIALQTMPVKEKPSLFDHFETTQPIPLTIPSPPPSPPTNFFQVSEVDWSLYVPSEKEIRCVIPLEELVNFPLSNPNPIAGSKSTDGKIVKIDVFHDEKEKAKYADVPSVSTILNSTLPETSKNALEHWKQKLITTLGKEGFDEFHKEQLRKGSEFHACMMKKMMGTPLEKTNLHNTTKKCLESVEHILKDIHNTAVVESHVVHPILGYRGIIDCVADYKGEQVIIEWKRSDKPKPVIKKTYDAPIQMCAYLGALSFDNNYKLNLKGGLVVVAYSDGSKADVFYLPLKDCSKYWKQWLSRLKYYLKSKNP